MRAAAVLFFVVSVPGAARAHDTWLLPARSAVNAGETVAMEMTSAMRFPEPEVAVTSDRIARSGLRVRGTTVPLRPAEGGAKALRLLAAPPAEGLATVWAESLPREIDRQPDQVEHYLAEAGAADARDRWVKGGRGRWHDTYVKFTKSFVRVGAEGDDRSWAEPVGMALEIVPQGDPVRLSAGQRLTLRVLEDGKPAAGLAVGAVASGGEPAATQVTDEQGQVTFALTAPGPWLIKAIRIRPGSAPGDWNSRFTTLTLSAKEPAAR